MNQIQFMIADQRALVAANVLALPKLSRS